MLDYTQLACPVCRRPFTAQDDVVVCPQCGAPYHRDCWHKAGGCTYASAHGTPEQWRPPVSRGDEEALICGNCGAPNEGDAQVCGKCGHALHEPLPLSPSEQQPAVDEAAFYSQFSPYIGIAPDSSMDGEPVMDVAAYVGPNSGYYLSRFYFMRMQKTRTSWNWMAALFPTEWLFYRKLTPLAYAALAATLVLLLPFFFAAGYALRLTGSDPALINDFLLAGRLPGDGLPYWLVLLANLSGILSFALRLAMGLKANRLYDRKVFRDIRRIRADCPDPLRYRYTLSRRGGISRLAVVLYYAAIIILVLAACSVGALLAG